MEKVFSILLIVFDAFSLATRKFWQFERVILIFEWHETKQNRLINDKILTKIVSKWVCWLKIMRNTILKSGSFCVIWQILQWKCVSFHVQLWRQHNWGSNKSITWLLGWIFSTALISLAQFPPWFVNALLLRLWHHCHFVKFKMHMLFQALTEMN